MKNSTDYLENIEALITNLPEEISNAEGVADSLDDISTKLDDIIEYLKMQQVAMEKYYEDIGYINREYHKSIYDISLDNILSYNSILMLGYSTKDVISYISGTSSEKGLSCLSVRDYRRPAELTEALLKISDDSIIIVDYDSLGCYSAMHRTIFDAINYGTIKIKIGAGVKSNWVNISVPKCHYIFFAASDMYIPNRDRMDFECCFSCREFEEHGEVL